LHCETKKVWDDLADRPLRGLRTWLDTVKRQFERLRQIDVAVKVERDLTAPLH
jgi:hypothetical protein